MLETSSRCSVKNQCWEKCWGGGSGLGGVTDREAVGIGQVARVIGLSPARAGIIDHLLGRFRRNIQRRFCSEQPFGLLFHGFAVLCIGRVEIGPPLEVSDDLAQILRDLRMER